MRRRLGLFLFWFALIGLLLPSITPQQTKEEVVETPIFIQIVAAAQIPCHIEYGNIYTGYQPKFTEPFEVCYFIFKNGDVLRLTNHLPVAIFFPINLDEIIKAAGHSYEDIMVIIHNHLLPSTFSQADKKCYYHFVAKGFKGSYQLYIQPNKKIYEFKK